MLKFDAWPPEAGKVTFSPSSLRLIREFEASDKSDESKETQALHDIARHSGRLVAANVDFDTTTAIEKDLYSQLPEGAAREIFNHAFLWGAGREANDSVLSQ
jgi:hypothetical protein